MTDVIFGTVEVGQFIS